MSSTAAAKTFHPENDQEVLIQFDDGAFDPITPYHEDFEDQVRVAQEQLQQLRHREEQLERQKRELEELQLRKEEFTKGRARLAERLARAVSVLEREAEETQRRADHCLDTRGVLEHHMLTLQSLRPENWSRNQLQEELTDALAHIEEAESEMESAQPLLESFRSGKKQYRSLSSGLRAGEAIPQDFVYWFKCGLAFTLPVMIFGAITALMMMVFGGVG